MTEGRIALTRVYDAPRERVWRAWTDPDELVHWWGRRGWLAQRETLTMDVRPGGTFRVVTVSERDGAEMVSEYVYREVVAPARLVLGDPGGGESELATVTFTDLGDGRTEMRFRATVEAARALRDRMTAGLNSAFDRLAERLAQR